jgi:hypothetical protein
MTMATIKNVLYRAQVLTLLGTNLVVCWLAFQGADLLSGNWQQAMKDWAAAVPPGLGLLAAGAINGLIDDRGKARLVFLAATIHCRDAARSPSTCTATHGSTSRS